MKNLTRYHGTNDPEQIIKTGALLCRSLIKNRGNYEKTLERYEKLKDLDNHLECSALEERLNVYLGDSFETSKGYTVGDSRTVFEFEIPQELIGSDRFKETLVPEKVDLKYLKKIHTNKSNLGYVEKLLRGKNLEHIDVEKI